MTQPELIIEYINQNGSITPAKLNDKDRRVFIDSVEYGWLGSQTDKRCRELRAKGVLFSEKDGKYEVFRLTEAKPLESNPSASERVSSLSIGGMNIFEAQEAVKRAKMQDFIKGL